MKNHSIMKNAVFTTPYWTVSVLNLNVGLAILWATGTCLKVRENVKLVAQKEESYHGRRRGYHSIRIRMLGQHSHWKF